MEEIITKLDTLAEYYSQKDSIEARKRDLLDAVKIPDEVTAIQRKANADIEYQEQLGKVYNDNLRHEFEELLLGVTIPEEIRAVLSEIDEKRKAIRDEWDEKSRKGYVEIYDYRAKINNEIEEKTRQVYRDLETRKYEISAEFDGQQSAVDENIKALEAEIKAATKAEGKTVKGKFFTAVYVKGRVTWNTDMLDGMIAVLPQLGKARKEGEPSITLRRA